MDELASEDYLLCDRKDVPQQRHVERIYPAAKLRMFDQT